MKKSTSKKLNIFKTSPLIGVIAILEVIILICVSTFAWFVFADNNTVNTDVISVEPDSGLEIDFNDAAEDDYVNIWNYLNEFQFEPVTSLDGRNIFVPTTGTLNAIDTGKIKFREATVNDMNSKYINIDFTLTNTGEEAMPVYLSSKSFFKLYDPDTQAEINSKAIRIAFYQNDGSSGKITSSLLSQEYEGEEPTEPPTEAPTEDGGTVGGTYTVYLDAPSDWTDVGQVRAFVWGDTNSNGSFPGEVMTYDSTTGLFSYTYSTACNKVIFSYHGNQNQTVDLDVYDQGVYKLEEGRNGTWALENIEIDGGTKVDGSGSNTGTEPSTEAPTTPDDENYTTVYFNNTLGWEQPYAYIWRENGDNDEPLSDWPGKPMTHISGSVYYYTFNAKYDSIIFNDGNSEGGAVKTGDIYPVKDGHIYMIGNPTADNTYGWEMEDYIGTVDGGKYPVISPGVSTGFQRPYAPVIEIDDNSGSSRVVVPAFASSIDDYNFGSENPLFTIEPGQTLPLSMIIWLEGTDPDCTEDVYSGKFIDMNLVFATKDSGEDMYTFQFLDKTKENWIDDRVTTDTGVSFKPVIQLYDVDNHKGYQMSVHDDENGNPTIWQCRAPEDLINSEHIMFRRVNPMNEDEVWNYWDTSGFNGKTGAVVDSTVYFSAFSDGAPTNATDKNGNNTSGAPMKSCGGLWGNHETQIVTVYDGTDGQWIKNSDVSGTTSVLTMNYTYDGQTVEYKASGATDKGLYYFVVPMDIYSKQNSTRPEITLKRYYNFNDKYALNSDKNTLTYHTAWNIGMCNGKFAQIKSDESNACYWGSDMLYIQTRKALNSKIDGSYMQVHFYSTNSTTTAGNYDTYVPIHRNDYYAASNDGYGFACVVPSNTNYYYYRVERCNPNDHYTVWNATPAQTINRETTTNNAYSNTVGKNICTIDYMFLKIYLECSTTYCGDSWDPEIYVFKSSGGEEKAWPGSTMTWSKNGTEENGSAAYKQYYYDVNVSSYDRIIFSNDYDYGNQRRQTGDIVVGTDDQVSGMIYQWDSGNQRWRSTHKTGVTANETLHVTLYDTDWDKNGS